MSISRSQMSSQLKGGRKMPTKKLSANQSKLAKVAPPKNKITGADFKKLKKSKPSNRRKKK
tara:strand:- start:3338 stop:3520 length:183 start_codon:yes stop_codon:yes gene_type:complete